MNISKPHIPVSPVAAASALIRTYRMQNVRIINGQKNPYEGKIPGAVQIDPALYKSVLGTPVFTDLTIGDKVNTQYNQWTDQNGRVHSFTPMTFVAVLMNVSFPKDIVKTKIQGRPGSVKEYIGEGDAEISINGIITAPNGHYPIDEVKQLQMIRKAPIPIVVTSWYLQNLDVDMIVIEDLEIGQDEGGYSYQTFSIKASSDLPVELKLSNV